MTREEMKELKGLAASMGLYDDKNPCKRAVILGKAIKTLEQEPCEDAISRQSVLDINEHHCGQMSRSLNHEIWKEIKALPSVTPKEKIGHCKDCKYFEYDSVANVNGIPLIVAHEICSRWGDGCKTKEDGYCFLFEAADKEVER